MKSQSHELSFLDHVSLDVSDMFKVFVSLHVTNYVEIDGIGPEVLKHCATTFCVALHQQFSLSLSQHTFPNEWRIHSIKPIYKSGNKSDVRNYKPISLHVVHRIENLGKACLQKIIEFITNSIVHNFMKKVRR